MPPLRVLFVCSRNQWRSPTAERLFRREPGLEVRSAGTSRAARRTVREEDLRWADLVLVMEPAHARRLRATHPRACADVALEVLDIPDDYRADDPELIAILEEAVPPILARHR